MIIFLYGQDTYRSRQKLNEIIEQYKKIHKSGLSLIYLDAENLEKAKRSPSFSSSPSFSRAIAKGEEESLLSSPSLRESSVFENFRDAIQQTSMFGEKKLIVLSNIFANQDFKEKFFKNYKNFFKLKPNAKIELDAEDIILFYEENKILEKDKFLNFLKTKTKTQNFEPLEGEKLKNWVRQELSKFKTEINPEALNKLINFVGNDLWQMSNEIKKLASFKKDKKGKEDKSSSSPAQAIAQSKRKDLSFRPFAATREINVEDVELLIKPKIETAIFKTIDAIAQKNKKQALLLIHKHLEKGDNPLYLLSMINFQFRNLLIIKDLIERHSPYYSISKMTGLHPFIVKKSHQQADKFTLQELKKIYRRIFEVDLAIKTGKIGSETALDLLITEI